MDVLAGGMMMTSSHRKRMRDFFVRARVGLVISLVVGYYLSYPFTGHNL